MSFQVGRYRTIDNERGVTITETTLLLLIAVVVISAIAFFARGTNDVFAYTGYRMASPEGGGTFGTYKTDACSGGGHYFFCGESNNDTGLGNSDGNNVSGTGSGTGTPHP